MGEGRCSSRQRDDFCRAYLRTLDPQRAAEAAECEDGFALLQNRAVRARLERMRTEQDGQILRADAVRRLAELAFGRANDAVALALAENRAEKDIRGLDLSAVAEFRVTDKGGVEVKFLDRLRALEALCALLGEQDGAAAEAFFRALEETGETEGP